MYVNYKDLTGDYDDNVLRWFAKVFSGGVARQFSGATNGAVIERQFHRNELKAPSREGAVLPRA